MRSLKKLSTVCAFVLLTSVTALAGCSGSGGVQKPGNSLNPSQGQGAEASQPPRVAVKSAVDSQEKAGSESGDARNEGQQPKAQIVMPAAEAKTSSGKKKVVYLTFDDGPNSDYTEKALDILRKKKVKASFMVVGRNVMLNPRVLQRILADGHAVINHTYSHDYNIIYRSPDSFIADLDENNKIITKYTGKPVMVFRAPGGPDKLNKEFNTRLRGRGYISVGWNISAVDSDPHGVTSSQVYNNIADGLERVEQLKLTPIVLMHDGTQLTTTQARPGTPLAAYIQNREATLGALPAVIDLFASKGYTFAVVDEKTPPAW